MVTAGKVRRAKQKTIGGKKDRCRKGKSCSATCISRWKDCLVEMSDAVSSSLTKTRKAIGKRAEKVVPGLKGKYLERRRKEYLKAREFLRTQIKAEGYLGPSRKLNRLNEKLERLDKTIGSRLGIPKAKPVSREEQSSYDRRAKKYLNALSKVKQQVIQASKEGKKGTYDKLEKKLLDIQSKGGSKFPGLEPKYEKGKFWKDYSGNREGRRGQSYIRAYQKFRAEAEAAARAGDYKRYNKAESALLKIQDRTGDKFDPYQFKIKKGGIWGEEKIGVAARKVEDDMIKAIAAGDRSRFDKLESRLLRIVDKFGSSFDNKDLTRGARGDGWNEYQGLAHFLSRLDKTNLKQAREGVKGMKIEYGAGGGQFVKVSSMVLGNRLDVDVSPTSYNFKVNGSYFASDNLTRKEKVAIIREVTRQFDEITKAMGEGTTLSVIAASGDQREGMRKRGYNDYGFSPPDAAGEMFGKVVGGKVAPIDREEYKAGKSSRFRVKA